MIQFHSRKLVKRRDSGSKMVRDQAHATDVFLASLETSRHKVAARLGEHLAPELRDGETLPDFALAFDLIGRSVKTARGELLEADRQYDRSIKDYNYLSRRAKWAADDARPDVRRVRGSIDGVYGKAGGERIHGIVGKLSQDPWGLRDQLCNIIRRLHDRAAKWPPPATPGYEKVDRNAWLEELEPAGAELEEILKGLERLRSEKTFQCDERKAALKASKAVLGKARRLLTAAYEIAGFNRRHTNDLLPRREVRQRGRQARVRREERRRKAGRKTPAPRPGGLRATLRSNLRRWLSPSWLRGAATAWPARKRRD